MAINFDVTEEENALIKKIAERAEKEVFGPDHVPQSQMDTIMDLSATIAQGCPLKLQELLDADLGNFGHDVAGIRRHINRETGLLEGGFLPRFYNPVRK